MRTIITVAGKRWFWLHPETCWPHLVEVIPLRLWIHTPNQRTWHTALRHRLGRICFTPSEPLGFGFVEYFCTRFVLVTITRTTINQNFCIIGMSSHCHIATLLISMWHIPYQSLLLIMHHSESCVFIESAPYTCDLGIKEVPYQKTAAEMAPHICRGNMDGHGIYHTLVSYRSMTSC